MGSLRRGCFLDFWYFRGCRIVGDRRLSSEASLSGAKACGSKWVDFFLNMTFPDRVICSVRYLVLHMSYTRRHLLQGSLAGGAAGVLTGLVQGQEGSGAKDDP